MSSLSASINDAVIRRLAGDQSYKKGYDYYRHGQAESLEAEADALRAVVCGNQDYAVTLSSDEGILDYACDCPYMAPPARSASTASPQRSPG